MRKHDGRIYESMTAEFFVGIAGTVLSLLVFRPFQAKWTSQVTGIEVPTESKRLWAFIVQSIALFGSWMPYLLSSLDDVAILSLGACFGAARLIQYSLQAVRRRRGSGRRPG
ncbi:MAG: hypothetical protein JSS66_18310 [Armatimonadetes bacterium]|nr:hypothetical protein [Armatimonadota bacterium]